MKDNHVATLEHVSSQVGRLSKEQYLGYFVGGLRELLSRVHIFSPRTQMQAMKLACNVEVELHELLAPLGGVNGGP